MNFMKLKKIRNNEFIRNIAILMTGTTVAQAIPIAISPILTRIYSPEEFGVFALYLSIVTVLAVIATGRYEFAVMLPDDDEDAIYILVLSLIIAGLFSGMLLLIVFFFNETIATYLGNKNIKNWLYLVPFAVLILSAYQGFNFWFNRKKEYRNLATNRMQQSFINAGANLGMGFNSFNASGLILGNFLSQLYVSFNLGRKIIKSQKKILKKVNKGKIFKNASKYREFPLFSVWTGLLNILSLQIPIFILSSFFSNAIVGFYSLAHKLINLPISVLGNSVSQVYFQKAAEYVNNKPKLMELTYQTYKKLLILGTISLTIIIGYGDKVFSFVLGPEWGIAGSYARILSVWMLFVFASSPLSNLYSILNKQKEGFIFNLVIFFARLIALLIGVLTYQDPYITIWLFGIVGAVMWLFHSVYILSWVGIRISQSLITTSIIVVPPIFLIITIRYFINL